MKKNILALAIILILGAVAAFLFFNFGQQPPAVSQEASLPASSAPLVTPSDTPSISISVEPQVSVTPTPTEEPMNPRYVFIMIGDGMGVGQRELAQDCLRLKAGDESAKLFMDTLPVTGKVSTASASSKVTDSAASGTAYATGHKTKNTMLSVDPSGKKLETIMERAETYGMSTGVVTTSYLSDATPAAFCVHSDSRSLGNDIAAAYLTSGVDFIAGGGANHFLPAGYTGGNDTWGDPLVSERTDDRNLFTEFEQEGYKTFCGADGWSQFKDFGPTPGDKVLAAFANVCMPYELDRVNEGMDSPTLSEMTEKAISTLESDRDGFVLMVEGGRIDQACHYTDAASAASETLAFDGAVKTAYDFYSEHPDQTLIIVVADHETGGLGQKSNTDLSVFDSVKASTEGSLKFVYTEKGDRSVFYKYIADNLGLGNLSVSEKKKVETALNYVDNNKTDRKLYGSYNQPAIAATDIISERAGIKWSSPFTHTGVNVPLSAVGWESEEFAGLHGNDEIGRLLFEMLNFER